MGANVLKLWFLAWLLMAVTGCGVPQNSIEAQTAREAAAANCDAKGKCVKDPNGLVLYNSDLVTEGFVLKRPEQDPTLLTKLMNLIDEPKLLVTSDKLEPLIRGVAIVGEFERCDSPKGIDGANPTAGQLRSLKQGRYKACISYIGDGLFKRAYALSPIDVDTTPPEVAQIGVTHMVVTPTTAGLAWSKAGDNLTLDGKLVYSVYTSKTNVLDSIEAVRTQGNLVPGLLIGGMSYTITSLSENTNYHAAVVVTDEAGNQSLVGHTNFRTTTSDTNPSDTNPPTSPSVVINVNDSYTNTTAATLTLGAVDASEMYVTDADGCTSGGTWEPYVTSKSWTLAQTNATATAYAKFRDLAGNETGCVNDTIIHDDIAPTAPNVIGATPTNDTTPSWSWTSGGGGNGAYRYKLNSADLTTGASETTGTTFTVSPALSEGTHTLYVQERDAAGNWSASGSRAVVIDTTAPALTINDASANLVTPVNQASYSGVTGTCSTTDGSVTVSFTKTPSAPVTLTAACSAGSWSAGAANLSPFTDGTVTITAMQTDAATNSASVSTTTTKDTAAPNTPTVTGTTPTSSVTPTWTWTSGGGGGSGTYRYKLNSADLTTGASETTGATFTASPALSEGTHTLYVQERDAAGNWSASGSRAVVIDTTAPNAPAVTGTTPTANTTPTWSWSSGGNGGNGTYRYKLNDPNLSTGATETASTTFTPGTALSEATHTLYVQERDAAGNWSTSGSFAIQVVTPPAAPTLSTPTRYVTSLGLSWASVAEATSYNLYWATTAGVTIASTKISDVVSAHTHSSLSGGAPYYYKLAAVKNGVEGALSNEVSGTPFVGQVAAPVMSPAAGTYASTQTVTLTSSTNGAVIYYRLDGVSASCSAGSIYTTPITVSATTTISSIACATNHQDSNPSSGAFTIETVIADNNYGRFFGWGFNSDGRLGNGTTSAITSPSQIGSDSDWTALVHSMYHSAGIRLGKLYTWGRNVEGQLGNGSTTNSLSPVEILPPSVLPNIDNRWTHVSVGWYHTVAIRGGKLYAWGENVCGQLGDGTTTRRNIPVQIGTDTDWTHVSAGGHVTVGIRGGKLYGWGDTTNGVIGNNATAANCILYDETVPIHRSPTQIGIDSDWTHVSTSGTHTLGIRNNGRLYALGYNEYGKLGDGTSVNKNTLTQIGTASDWTSVSTGRIHTVGLRSGMIFAWGSNWYGQLGTGGSTNSAGAFVTTPQQIGVENTWSTVSAADDHTMAIRGGSLYGWGANHNRQLGDGTTTQRNTPTLIGSSTDWIYIWAGGSVSLGIQKPAAGFIASCAGDCYMEGSAPGYAQSLPVGTERLGPAGVTMSLQHANGSSGFKIWKEKSGSRILNASGIPTIGWQKQLDPTGTSFSGSDFNTVSTIAGRACPGSVFRSHVNPSSSNSCLYFDGGNSTQRLDSGSGLEAQDWLSLWWNAATGQGTNSSYFEGNVKTCADKGMRLPTIFEVSVSSLGVYNPYLPTGDGVNPSLAGAAGVPSVNTGWTWTSSAYTYGGLDGDYYYTWSGSSTGVNGFNDSTIALRCVLPNSIPACTGDCYLEGSAPNYAQDLMTGTERQGPSGTTISLQFASATSGFKVWKEKSGTRILNATGLVVNGWQKQLTRAGTGFSATDFTTSTNIAGRACPTHVFLSHSNMTATNRCLYYDNINPNQTLNAVGGIEAQDWLTSWNRAATGAGVSPSWFEGNIKTCADKGMRLPTLYETSVPTPTTGMPTDAAPTFGGTRVPSSTGSSYDYAWTASAHTTSSINYWQWNNASESWDNYDDNDYGPYQLRCVLP